MGNILGTGFDPFGNKYQSSAVNDDVNQPKITKTVILPTTMPGNKKDYDIGQLISLSADKIIKAESEVVPEKISDNKSNTELISPKELSKLLLNDDNYMKYIYELISEVFHSRIGACYPVNGILSAIYKLLEAIYEK